MACLCDFFNTCSNAAQCSLLPLAVDLNFRRSPCALKSFSCWTFIFEKGGLSHGFRLLHMFPENDTVGDVMDIYITRR